MASDDDSMDNDMAQTLATDGSDKLERHDASNPTSVHVVGNLLDTLQQGLVYRELTVSMVLFPLHLPGHGVCGVAIE